MTLTLKFRDSDARQIAYFLRRRFKSKARLDSIVALERMVKVVIREAVAEEAKKELAESEYKRLAMDGAVK